MPSFSPYDLLNRKRRGEALEPEAIRWMVEAFGRGEVTDYQMTAFLMAVAIRGMSGTETAALTAAVVGSGEQWEIRKEFDFIADKHSTGGVGDKVSLCLSPWVAACGVKIGMLSGRGLGHTGGTLDKLETIPGFRAGLSRREIVEVIGRTGCAIATSTESIAPADRRMYALRDVTGTVESLPLITASIMSKKIAFGASALLLDVKTGSGAFMSSHESASTLARSLLAAGRGTGMKVEAMLTDMNAPIGRAVGNANEVHEAMDVLKGTGPADLTALTRAQAERILLASGRHTPAGASVALDAAIESGAALRTAAAWIEAQGGDPAFIDRPERLGTARHALEVAAPRTGFLDTMNTYEIGMIAVELGAGRKRQDDPIDPTAGIEVLASVGDPVRAGEPVAVLSWSRDGIDAAGLARRYLAAIAVTADRPLARPLIHEIFGDPE